MFNFTELFYYKSKIYILFNETVKNELIKLHHDNVLTEHYKVNRTINLLFMLRSGILAASMKQNRISIRN